MEAGAVVALCWCAFLTVLWAGLASFVILLWKKISKLTDYPKRSPENALQNPHAKPISTYSYGSPAIEPGEDLAKRGYAKHEPRPTTPEPTEDRYNMMAASVHNRNNPNTSFRRNEETAEIYYGDEYASSTGKPPKAHSLPKKQTSEVPHFFSSQLSHNSHPPGAIIKSGPSTSAEQNHQQRSQALVNPNFQY